MIEKKEKKYKNKIKSDRETYSNIKWLKVKLLCSVWWVINDIMSIIDLCVWIFLDDKKIWTCFTC